MIRDFVLRIFLSIPLIHELTLFLLDLLVKDKRAKEALIGLKPLKFNFLSIQKSSNLSDYTWLIQTSIPSDDSSQKWGDKYFAEEIKNALEKQGQTVQILDREQQVSIHGKKIIYLNLRGLLPFHPISQGINVLWIISHPSQISKYEVKKYDLVFAASNDWAKKKSNKWKIKIFPLLQATNAKVFNPGDSNIVRNDEILFVGNSRGVFRKSVKVASQLKTQLKIIGSGWEKFLPSKFIKQEFVNNKDLPDWYRSAGLVLNDHWSDMARAGFISNRLFDAVASGAKVVSDQVQGIDELFDGAVIQYSNNSELAKLLSDISKLEFGDEQEIVTRASRIGTENSFENRAKILIQNISNLISN